MFAAFRILFSFSFFFIIGLINELMRLAVCAKLVLYTHFGVKFSLAPSRLLSFSGEKRGETKVEKKEKEK